MPRPYNFHPICAGLVRNNSCKDCTDRVVGCHSTCEKYKQFKAQIEEAKHREHAGVEADSLSFDRAYRIEKRLQGGKPGHRM